MFPDDRKLSTSPHRAPYLSPDNLDGFRRRVDYERAGLALHDTSKGLLYQTWRVAWDAITKNVILTNESGFEQVMFTAINVTQLSVTFDRSMTPYFAYTESGSTWLRWSLPSGVTEKMLIPGATQPRLTFDDKREESAIISDVTLVYLRGTSLCKRIQRERFLTEEVLAVDVIGTRLGRVGMTTGNRVQIELLP